MNSRDKIFLNGGGCKTWAFHMIGFVLVWSGPSGVSDPFYPEFVHGTVCLSQDHSLLKCLADPVGGCINIDFIFGFLVMSSLLRSMTEFIASLICLLSLLG